MNKFEEVYRKIISEESINRTNIKEVIKDLNFLIRLIPSEFKKVLKGDIVLLKESNIEEVIKDLNFLIKQTTIPGKLRKVFMDDIGLLKGADVNGGDEVIKDYIGKTDKGKVEAEICIDGSGHYYFILKDDDDEWYSYEHDSEFDNETGIWESEEECLAEMKEAINEFWRIDLKKMKLEK